MSIASRALRASQLLFVGLALGCAGCGAPPPAVDAADQAKSSATIVAVEDQSPGPSGARVAVDAAPVTAAAPTVAADDAIPEPASLGIFKLMPRECDEGRVYVNTGKVLAGKSGAALDAVIVSMARLEAKKGDKLLKILKAGGIEPVMGTTEFAACISADQTKFVLAVSTDLSKAKKPAETIAKAIEAEDGKAPKVEVEGEVTYLSSSTGSDVLAVIGKSTLLFGKDRALLTASVKGGNGAGFGSAVGKVVWIRAKDKRTEVDAVEAGDVYELRVSVEDRNPERTKSQIESMMPELDVMIGRMPPGAQKVVQPLLPIARNAKIEVRGKTLVATTRFPKSAAGEALTAAGKLKPEELDKLFDL